MQLLAAAPISSAAATGLMVAGLQMLPPFAFEVAAVDGGCGGGGGGKGGGL